jgi:hypothetical protein
MTCNEVRNVLASRDRDQELPEPVQTHLKQCFQCNRIARAMTAAEQAVHPVGTASRTDNTIVDTVMEQIRTVPPGYAPGDPPRTSLATWISGGLLLSGALVAVRFSESFQYLTRSTLGHTVDLWVTLSLSTILAGYLCVFAGSNAVRREPPARENIFTSEAE